jgi:predicted DNA-binding antitoxin AbrB/MazE fold protein
MKLMKQTAKAVYENGVLRPTTLLFDLAEGEEVLITVQAFEKLTPEEEARRRAELMRQLEAEGALEHDDELDEEDEEEGDEDLPDDPEPIEIEGEPLSETIIKMRRGEV